MRPQRAIWEQPESEHQVAQKAPTRRGQYIPAQLKTEPLHSWSVSRQKFFKIIHQSL
jgi:hypothetical protein